jgi:hypothetical protein
MSAPAADDYHSESDEDYVPTTGKCKGSIIISHLRTLILAVELEQEDGQRRVCLRVRPPTSSRFLTSAGSEPRQKMKQVSAQSKVNELPLQ